MHVADTRLPIIVVSVVAVAVSVRDTEPDDGECRPTDDERGAEQRHVVAPAHVHQGGEDVDEVATTALGHVLAGDVTAAVLVYDPSSLTCRKASSTVNQCLEDTSVQHRLVTITILHQYVTHLL